MWNWYERVKNSDGTFEDNYPEIGNSRQQFLNFHYRKFWANLKGYSSSYDLFGQHLVDVAKITGENKTFVPSDKDIPQVKNNRDKENVIEYITYSNINGRYLQDYCYISGCPS